jgi:hypothetical protein
MKEIMRKTIAFLVAILALTATSTVSFAAPDADFDGSGQTPVWRYDAVNVTAYGYDAFGMLTKELYPGDTKSINVALRNNTSDEVMFRLVAEPVTKDQAKGLEPYFQASSTYNPTTSDKIANDSLLGLITLQVNQGASILYSGPLSGAGGSGSLYNKTNNILTDGASIGRVSPGWQGTVSVQITVPTTVPSEYMSKLCAVKW